MITTVVTPDVGRPAIYRSSEDARVELARPLTQRRRWGRRLKRPEHRGGQDGRHDNGEGDVEIFAHSQRLSARHA